VNIHLDGWQDRAALSQHPEQGHGRLLQFMFWKATDVSSHAVNIVACGEPREYSIQMPVINLNAYLI
jgi:hypothetical protein